MPFPVSRSAAPSLVRSYQVCEWVSPPSLPSPPPLLCDFAYTLLQCSLPFPFLCIELSRTLKKESSLQDNNTLENKEVRSTQSQHHHQYYGDNICTCPPPPLTSRFPPTAMAFSSFLSQRMGGGCQGCKDPTKAEFSADSWAADARGPSCRRI